MTYIDIHFLFPILLICSVGATDNQNHHRWSGADQLFDDDHDVEATDASKSHPVEDDNDKEESRTTNQENMLVAIKMRLNCLVASSWWTMIQTHAEPG